MDAGDIALLSAAGLAGGFVNSIAGGGSLIVFPAMVATGLGTVAANVTNSVALWPGYLGTLAGLGRSVLDQVRASAALMATATVGAAAGCAILLSTPSRAFDVIVPFLVIAATSLIAAQPAIRRRVARGREGTDQHVSQRWLYVAVVVGSVYGGYFGGGLGVILLAVLGLTMPGPLTSTNGVKGLLQAVIGTVSFVAFALFGPVDWVVAAITAPTAVIGGVVGGRLTRLVDERWLRAGVVVFGLLIGAWLAYRAVSGS